jgi:hypothetical protein
MPYELLVRNLLTGYTPVPAVFSLQYWGANFGFDNSVQMQHEEVAERYGITGLSMRDLVQPFIEAERKPWATKEDVLKDK